MITGFQAFDKTQDGMAQSAGAAEHTNGISDEG